MDFQREIEELHEVFESYFLGHSSSLERVDLVLAANFTMVGPNGQESSRSETMDALANGHAHTDSLKISTHEHVLLVETPTTVVARYVEHHQLRDTSNERVATVVFTRDQDKPNGVTWTAVHETWRGRDD